MLLGEFLVMEFLGCHIRFDREPVVEQKNRINGEFDVFSNLN
jgi:hypothetical protein